jgi:bidirectional [NiFe] hydrogenase diaphorase subunit
MDLAELTEIARKESDSHKPVQIRCCIAAACLATNSQAVKQSLEEAVTAENLAEQVEVYGVGCMRLCCQGPLVQVEKTLNQKVQVRSTKKLHLMMHLQLLLL